MGWKRRVVLFQGKKKGTEMLSGLMHEEKHNEWWSKLGSSAFRASLWVFIF